MIKNAEIHTLTDCCIGAYLRFSILHKYTSLYRARYQTTNLLIGR